MVGLGSDAPAKTSDVVPTDSPACPNSDSPLAQIAAMADTHFLIEKMVDENHSETVIRPLDKLQSEQELARILGGVEITESVLENAREMKALANQKSSDSF